MKKLLIPIIALALMTTACNSKKDAANQAGIDLANLDTTVSPHVDFYKYACGGWMKNNPLTGEYSRFGSFDKLAENNQKQLKGLITDIAAKPSVQGSVEQKIGDLYNQAMDSTKLNADGYKPLQADLKKIASVKQVTELSKLLPDLLMSGLTPYFGVYVDADPMSSSQNLVQTHQGGISLGEREYYLDNDAHTKMIRDKYKLHVVKMFELVGFATSDAQKNMESVMTIETRLAKAAYDNVKLRDPHANYNKMKVTDLQKLVPVIDWNVYFTSLGLKNIKDVSVSQKESLVEAGKIIESEPLAAQIAYLQWKLIDESASYLSDELGAQNFDFYGKTLSGKKEQKPRWKRAVGSVDGSLGEAVGQMYVKKYFPA
ncbi:MAG TPA: M13 family metallopeptidase N-terminal domain-containing protein, partial [Paludibacter sp.]